MNKLIITVLAVAAVGAFVEAGSSLEECKAKLQAEVANVKVPQEFEKIAAETREQDSSYEIYSLVALFNKDSGPFDAASYVAGLSAAQKEHLREVASSFQESAQSVLSKVGCSQEDIESLTNIESFDYFLVKAGKQIGNFNAYVALSSSLLENLH